MKNDRNLALQLHVVPKAPVVVREQDEEEEKLDSGIVPRRPREETTDVYELLSAFGL